MLFKSHCTLEIGKKWNFEELGKLKFSLWSVLVQNSRFYNYSSLFWCWGRSLELNSTLTISFRLQDLSY